MGVLRRELSAARLIKVAAAVLGPSDQPVPYLDLIQTALDIMITADWMKVETFGRDSTDPSGMSGPRQEQTQPESVRLHMLLAAVATEVAARLPLEDEVVDYLEKLQHAIGRQRSDNGWFWPKVGIMLRMLTNRGRWVMFIQETFTPELREQLTKAGVMASSTRVDAFAARLNELRHRELTSCFVTDGLIVPEDKAWIYGDTAPILRLFAQSDTPDLMQQVALGFLAPRSETRDLRMSEVKGTGWERDRGWDVSGLTVSFTAYLTFHIRLDGHVDLGESTSFPAERVFTEAGCSWGYEPFRFIQLLRLYGMVVTAEQARRESPDTDSPQVASRPRRRRPPKVTEIRDFWIPRLRRGRLEPETVLEDLTRTVRRASRKHGRHFVPGFDRDLPAGQSPSQTQIDLAAAAHVTLRPGKTWVGGHHRGTGPLITSHHAKPSGDTP